MINRFIDNENNLLTSCFVSPTSLLWCCVFLRGECRLVYDRVQRQRQRWELGVVTDLKRKRKVVEGKEEFIWVGSTEPKANLNKSNNGLSRVQRGGRLMASVVYISQHKQLRAAAFVPLLFILFLFWQLRHNAGVGLAPTGRVCAVCR